MTLEKKTEITIEIVKSAGALALNFFQDLSNLNVEEKLGLISLRYPAAHGQQLQMWSCLFDHFAAHLGQSGGSEVWPNAVAT